MSMIDLIGPERVKVITIEDDDVLVEYQIPGDPGMGNLLEYAEPLSLNLEDADAPCSLEFRLATVAFMQAVVEETRRVVTSRLSPCRNCRGQCCIEPDIIPVREQDIDRMRAGVPSFSEDRHIIRWAALDMGGHVGEFKKVPFKGEDEYACPFLSLDGICTIYDYRPRRCRDFMAYNCSMFKEKE